MSTPTQHVMTDFGALALVRSVRFSLVCIAPAAMAVAVVLTTSALGVLDPVPETDYGPGYTFADGEPARVAEDRHDVITIAMIALAGLVGLVVPSMVLVRRQPPGTRLTLDDWGITELEGDDVRTAIAWEGSTVRARQTNLGSRVVGRILSVASPDGWAIFVGFGRWGVPLWALRRRTTGVVDVTTPSALRERLGDGPIPIDPRDARRGLFVVSRVLDLAFVSIGALAVVLIGAHELHEPPWVLAAAGVVACLRAARPYAELRALAVEHGRLFGAQRFRLAGAIAPGIAKAEDAEGAMVTLDLREAKHPDALLATRWLEVYAATDVVTGAEATMRVRAVETAQGWNERARLRIANRIEIALRLALGLGLVVAGVLLANGFA